MSHYAEVKDGVVTRVLVVDDSVEDGQTFLAETLGFGGTWVKTSYNTHGNQHATGGTPLHKNFAGIGYLWDGTGFFHPKPYPSWTFNNSTYLWEPPTPMPTDDKQYVWNEPTLSWKVVK